MSQAARRLALAEWLTHGEAAAMAGVSTKTFDRQVRLGVYPKGQAVPGLRRPRWHRASLKAAIDSLAGIAAESANDWEARKKRWREAHP